MSLLASLTIGAHGLWPVPAARAHNRFLQRCRNTMDPFRLYFSRNTTPTTPRPYLLINPSTRPFFEGAQATTPGSTNGSRHLSASIHTSLIYQNPLIFSLVKINPCARDQVSKGENRLLDTRLILTKSAMQARIYFGGSSITTIMP